MFARWAATVVNLLKVEAAAGLVGDTRVGSRTPEPALSTTIQVDDADATCAELTARGR